MESFLGKIQSLLGKIPFPHDLQDTYKLILGTPQFPFWFIIQSIWECYIVKRSIFYNSKLDLFETPQEEIERVRPCFSEEKENNIQDETKDEIKDETKDKNSKPKKLSLAKVYLPLIPCYILCFAMNFLPRELFAYFFKMPSPIKKNNDLIFIFTFIFIILFLFPKDFIFKLIDFKLFALILGVLQGANQTRFFKLILRHSNKVLMPMQTLPVVAGFFVLDSFIYFFFSPILNWNGRRTLVSNGNTMCYNIGLVLLYLTFTVANKISRDFFNGIQMNDIFATMTLMMSLSAYNGINAVQTDRPLDKKSQKVENEYY